MINIYIGTGSSPTQSVASGGISTPIGLGNGINEIVLEIVGTQTVRYPLYIQYQNARDRDNDGFIEINTLNDLNAIRDEPSSNYELTRHLDFNDPNSYVLGVVNRTWTSDPGWLPISNFTGNFNGNGFTIANLQINRDVVRQGLFSTISVRSIIRDIGLLNVEIIGSNSVGALAGTNFGTVIGSYATGEIHGGRRTGGLIGESNNGIIMNSQAHVLVNGSGTDIGALVGRNTGTDAMIINSYASGRIVGDSWVGGLTGSSDGKILNSYAAVSIRGTNSSPHLGGLVAENAGASAVIENSYAVGSVSSASGGSGSYGALIGHIRNRAEVIDSYAIGNVADAGSNIGGLIGRRSGSATVTHSYWDGETTGQNRSSGGSSRTTVQLQMPTGATGIYSNWSGNDWDFGTTRTYPVLKYAQNPDSEGPSACNGNGLPNCSDLIAPQIRHGLIALTLAGEVNKLSPAFNKDANTYYGLAMAESAAIQLIATALDTNANITIYRDDGRTRSQIGSAFGSGVPSPEIMLDEDTVNIIVLEVDPSDTAAPTVSYVLRLRYKVLREINSLEDLYNIRNNLDGEYILTRNLDFRDAASYDDAAANKAAYTVDNYRDGDNEYTVEAGKPTPVATDTGWLPIGTVAAPFIGTLDGNGHTISNLQINNNDDTNKGLFGVIGASGVVRNLGMLDAEIEDINYLNRVRQVSMLAAVNRGTVIGSYTHGTVRGAHNQSGFVGRNFGEIINSHALVNVHNVVIGYAGISGFVINNDGLILNSHVSGEVTKNVTAFDIAGLASSCGATCKIRNSYADIRIQFSSRSSGLAGRNSGDIENTYVTGQNYTRPSGTEVGYLSNLVNSVGSISNSYSIMEDARSGLSGSITASLVGTLGGTLERSYFNSDKSSLPIVRRRIGSGQIIASSGQSTFELQSGTAQSTDPNGAYYNWSTADWDFGTGLQYPVLKYAQNPNLRSTRACDGNGLPNCGTLIPRRAISSLDLVRGRLNPGFDTRYRTHSGLVESDSPAIQLHVVAAQPDAKITFLVNNSQFGNRMTAGSGINSPNITLHETQVTRIAIQVISPGSEGMPGGVDQYTLLLRYRQVPVDKDDNPYIGISTLEELSAIRDNLNGNYALVNHLDFQNDADYSDIANKASYTVDDFSDSSDEGWVPIASVAAPFIGEFDGNGYTISNLQINRDLDAQGLFASIGSGGTVRNLGLLNAEVDVFYLERIVHRGTGGLAANNSGTVIGSYVVGKIANNWNGFATSTVGALIGTNTGQILNSYASGSITGNLQGGGLVGFSEGRIINSHVNVLVMIGGSHLVSGVGGMVGGCAAGCTILNSFAVGKVKGDGTTNNNGSGGFALTYSSGATYRNNYADVDTEGKNGGGFFNRVYLTSDSSLSSNYSIGMTQGQFTNRRFEREGGNIISDAPNYWNSETAAGNGVGAAALNASGKRTAELQMPTAPGTTSTEIYYGWSEDNWDFGTSDEYPILKYAANPGGEPSCDDVGLPDCGTLIAPQIRFGLSDLRTLINDLDPPYNKRFASYSGKVSRKFTRLIPTAKESDAMINIYIGTVTGKDSPDQSIASGEISAPIELGDGINRIVLEIVGTHTVQYPLYMQYEDSTDRDGDGLVEINNLDELDAIRNNVANGRLAGNYELSRHLDFNDPNSYASGEVNTAWTSSAGWVPIRAATGFFVGTFEGNGYTISNLYINRPASDEQALFAGLDFSTTATALYGTVRNLGLLNAKITANDDVGALIGVNRSTVIGCFAVGEITANDKVGGLIGRSVGSSRDRGAVINSYAEVMVSGNDGVGGLIGRSAGNKLFNSYAGGSVSGNSNVGGLVGRVDDVVTTRASIRNNYASGSVSGNSSVGGLVGLYNNEETFSDNYASGAVEGNWQIGGLIGDLAFVVSDSTINNSYASGSVMGRGNIGSLTGIASKNITIINSYADGTKNPNFRLKGSVAGKFTNSSTRTTVEMQAGREQSTTASEIYYQWDSANWDFGNRMQYPILKYAQSTATRVARICDGAGLPDCGTVISPQIFYGLQDLRLADDVTLTPPFGAEHRNVTGRYSGAVPLENNAIRLIPTAKESSATINIYISTVTGRNPDQSIISGGTSAPIELNDGINRIVLEIVGTRTVQYPLYIQQKDISDDSDFVEINNLDELNAIRDDLSGSYKLSRHLDFKDPNSYALGTVNTDWTVDNFGNSTDTGWTRIGTASTPFTGEFNGNGYTISNLQINDTADNQGLFGFIDARGVVRDIALLDVKIEAGNNIGGLAGTNAGTVIGSQVVGELRGGNNIGGLAGINDGTVIGSQVAGELRGGNKVGALVGNNRASAQIFNSYAIGNVYAGGDVGGLAGESHGVIVNSHTNVEVHASQPNVGGMVGYCASCTILNSFAVGAVNGSTTHGRGNRIGGFIGTVENTFKISNNYAYGDVAGGDLAHEANGGFSGLFTPIIDDQRIELSSNYSIGMTEGYFNSNQTVPGEITSPAAPNYWNTDTSGDSANDNVLNLSNLNVSGRTTAQLQAPTGATGIYGLWSTDNWDFGTSMQYPILKYAENPDDDGEAICGGEALPDCGTVISPQIRNGLQDLRLADDVTLTPPFGPEHRDLTGSYSGTIPLENNAIRLIPTAKEDSAMINIYISTVKGKDSPDQSIISGGTSTPIALDEGSNRIVLEIVGTQTVQYPLYIKRTADKDNNGFAEIDNLEDLNAIRDNLSGHYELTRSLDFYDPNSYASGEMNTNWTVDDFDNSSDTGWTPIGTTSTSFTGEFNGNGYTISNLQINRTSDNQGLFGFIAKRGVVRDLSLLYLKIEAGNNIGGLAGINDGTVIGSHVVGELRGGNKVGALIGNNRALAQIFNSRASGSVSAGGDVGGLAGESRGVIVNSHTNVEVTASEAGVGGMVGKCSSCTILNSFAVGAVNGSTTQGRDNHIGGFIGFLEGLFSIINNYAHGDVTGGDINDDDLNSSFIGNYNLVFSSAEISSNYSIGMTTGNFYGITGAVSSPPTTRAPNYWNNDRTDNTRTNGAINASGRTTTQLQAPTGAAGIYALWSTDNWDFGTSSQYPILKYAENPDSDGEAICGGEALPDCGGLIAPQIRFGLQSLRLADDVTLIPPFDADHQDLTGSYSGAVALSINTIRLIPEAKESDATINIYIDTVKDSPDQSIMSGGTSAPIALDEGINRIVLEIVGTQTVQYPLYIKRTDDRDNNGFTEIDNLEELNAIRDNLSGNYELSRSLDFYDPTSYASGEIPAGEVHEIWTTVIYEDPFASYGWVPIGTDSSGYTGEFNGNSFTISNLRINRTAGNQGLFASIDRSGIVRDITLLDVKIKANDNSGALAGTNNGTIIGSQMVGEIIGNNRVGALVGYNTASAQIYNSRASGSVSAGGNVGGLAGESRGVIVNSHSNVTVTASRPSVGGMVGKCSSCTIHNSFTVGAVNGSTTLRRNNHIGAFIGFLEGEFSIINNYAHGDVMGGDPDRNGNGGFIGYPVIRYSSAEISSNYSTGMTLGNFDSGESNSTGTLISRAPNYWNADTEGNSGTDISYLNASSKTTVALQSPISATGIYRLWSPDNWDFGTSSQYPTLKYAQFTSTRVARICDGEALPNCGEPIAPQIHFGLQSLSLADAHALSPPFGVKHWEAGSYLGTIVSDINTIRLVPTATEDSAMIDIYIGTVNEKDAPEQIIASGTPSTEIRLNRGSITRIVLRVRGTETVDYPLYIKHDYVYRGVDQAVNPIAINCLDELYAIREAPNLDYALQRDLDFNDDGSYCDVANKAAWTVLDASLHDSGWLPIPEFGGTFNGNGYAISNLRIGRNDSHNIGLFGTISESGMIYDLGLLNLNVFGSIYVSGIAGVNLGYIVGSYVINTARVLSNSNADIFSSQGSGSIAGINFGSIFNSRASNALLSTLDIGNIAGSNAATGQIINSYAIRGEVLGRIGGALVAANEGIISNSYAANSVSHNFTTARRLGGLVADNEGGFVSNTYAASTISDNTNNAAGLVVANNNGTIEKSYAIGSVSGFRRGGLVHTNSRGTIADSYWDIETSGVSSGNHGLGKTTAELQSSRAQSSTPTDAYYRWNEDNWDFGTAEQYPILKHAAGPEGNACGAAAQLPRCGTLLNPGLRYAENGDGLESLVARYGVLIPSFNVAEQNEIGIYYGTVENSTSDTNIELIATAQEATAIYSVYIGNSTTALHGGIASGNPSGAITLKAGGVTRVILEVKGTRTVRYTLYLNYVEKPVIDTDHDGLVEIQYLEDIQAIGLNFASGEIGYRASEIDNLNRIGCPGGVCRGYELQRSLDFKDPASYRDAEANMARWSNAGWEPIAIKGALFDGNGHTISNLKVRSRNGGGLFSTIESSDIEGLGLLNVDLSGARVSGGIARNLSAESRLGNSYVIGSIEATHSAGGLIAESTTSSISNSYFIGTIVTTDRTAGNAIGGLVSDQSGGYPECQ